MWGAVALEYSDQAGAVGAATGFPYQTSKSASSNTAPVSHSYGDTAMRLSYPFNGTTVLPITGRELGEKISAAILPFPQKEVAESAHRTTEAVKKWRSCAACPDSPSLLNMAREIPAVKWLVYEEIERGAPDGIISPRLMTEARQLLCEIAAGTGEHAEKARRILFANAAVRAKG